MSRPGDNNRSGSRVIPRLKETQHGRYHIHRPRDRLVGTVSGTGRSSWSRMRGRTRHGVILHLAHELFRVAWIIEFRAGRLWCHHSADAGRLVHEFASAECLATREDTGA